MKRPLYLLTLLAVVLIGYGLHVPVAFAQVTTATSTAGSGENILSCSNGEFATGVVNAAAVRVHVPVDDRAVRLNTAALVYKECILDSLARQMGQDATRAIAEENLRAAIEGNDGEPLYPTNLRRSTRERGVEAAEGVLQDDTLISGSPSFAKEIQTAASRDFYEKLNRPEARYECHFPGDHEAFIKGQADAFSWAGMWAVGVDPACRADSFAAMFVSDVRSAQSAAESEYLFKLQINQGYEDIVDENGDVVTPGSQVKTLVDQALGTPLRQAENQDEIGEVVEPLFAGLTAKVLNDPQGLLSLVLPEGTLGSYFDQLRQAMQGRLRGALVNTALRIIGNAIATEAEYRAHRQSALTSIQNAIAALRDIENQCWEEQGTPESERTTEHSDAVIEEEGLDQLEEFLANEVTSSREAQDALEALAETVQGAASGAAQSIALQQLGQLINLGQIHTTSDLETASQNAQDVAATMESLVNDTFDTWTGAGGWCNSTS